MNVVVARVLLTVVVMLNWVNVEVASTTFVSVVEGTDTVEKTVVIVLVSVATDVVVDIVNVSVVVVVVSVSVVV